MKKGATGSLFFCFFFEVISASNFGTVFFAHHLTQVGGDQFVHCGLGITRERNVELLIGVSAIPQQTECFDAGQLALTGFHMLLEHVLAALNDLVDHAVGGSRQTLHVHGSRDRIQSA